MSSNSHNSTASTGSDSVSGSKPGSRVLEAGEVAGDYSMDWKGETADGATGNPRGLLPRTAGSGNTVFCVRLPFHVFATLFVDVVDAGKG